MRTRRYTRAVLVAIVVAIAVLRFTFAAAYQLPAPHDLIYESPNLTTIRLIQQGRNIYGPETYAQPPFALTIYTSLYHHLVALFPTTGANPFFYGRLVALVGMLVAAAALFAVRTRDAEFQLVAASWFLLVSTVSANAAFLKNDSLALACAVWAVVLAARRGHPVLVAALCVLAIASKQSYVAASLACLVAYRHDRRFISSWAGLLGAFIALAFVLWGPGFWFSIVRAPQNPMLLSQQTRWWGTMLRDPAFVGLLVGACVTLWRRPEPPTSNYQFPIFAVYAIASWLVLLGTLGKAGSSTNYFFEPVLATFAWMISRLRSEDSWFPAAGAVVAGLLLFTPLSAFTTPGRTAETIERHAAIRRAFDAAGVDPETVLNLRAASLGFAAGTPFQINDPYLYGLVYQQGLLSTDPLRHAIESEAFDAVALPADGSIWATSPALAGVRDALARHYTERRMIAGEWFAFPPPD